MKIGQLAEATGVPSRTIRYYEGIGLLPSPPRDESGYRRYTEADASLLQFIQDAKKLALSLNDIRELVLVMPSSGVPSCSHVLELLEARRQEIIESIDRAERVRRTLDRTINQCAREMESAASSDECCNIVQRGSAVAPSA